MTNRLTHAVFKKELLRDPEVRVAYDELEEEFQLLREMIQARERADLTQAEVAKIMKTTPSAISRLESLPTRGRPSPSVATIKKYAHAVGCRIVIRMVPQEK